MATTRHQTPRRIMAGTAGALAIAVAALMPVAATASTATPAATGTTSCLAQTIAAKQSPSVDTLRASGDCQVKLRLTTLGRLSSEVSGSIVLTSSHVAALDAIITGTESSLQALQAKIDADTTASDLRTDIRAISTQDRVYVLVSRQVALVRADDQVDATAANLTARAGQLQAAIAAGQSAGKNESAAAARLAAMQRAIAAAEARVNGQAALVLVLTPAQWDSGSARPVLNADRRAVAAARRDLRIAAAREGATLRALR